jgi:hypothetical protein
VASGERKLVALLFADLSGFTALASSLDPEEVYAFIRPGLARALSLQATAARHTADRPTAERLLTQADNVLDRLRVPAHARPTVLAPSTNSTAGPSPPGRQEGRWPGAAKAG